VHIIAGASPDNTPAGYYWTFLFPELLFIGIALILWALFGRPHQRVPSRRIPLGLRWNGARVSPVAATAAGPDVAASAAAPLAASGAAPTVAIAEPSAAADESADGQPSADGAGVGE
jgi:hypothetical protein